MTSETKEILKKIEQEASENKKNKKKKKGILIIVIILLLAIPIIYGIMSRPEAIKVIANTIIDTIDKTISGNVRTGEMDMTDVDEIKAEMERKTNESYFTNRININPIFKDSKSEGNLMIENIKENKLLLQVEIIEQGDYGSIYKSPVLSPGQHIESDKLNKTLPKGTYNAIAYFNLYDMKTEKFVNKSGFKIKVTINN